MSGPVHEYDLIVLGAGAGGMTAAVVAANEGLKVLLIEKSAMVGGTTSISGGMVWVPNNHLMKAARISDSFAEAQEYLAETVPNESARRNLNRYLEAAPEAVKYLSEKTDVKLQPVKRYPDYYPNISGAKLGGRVLEPVPFDGSHLGDAFSLVRPPLPEFTILGGMMVARQDIPHFRKFARSPRSFLRIAGLIVRHAFQRLSHSRGTSLVLGNALVGRLLLSARKAGVEILLSSNVDHLVMDDGRCAGVHVVTQDRDRTVLSSRGVVIATGGFSHSAELRHAVMPQVANERSATFAGVAGDGIRLARQVGAAMSQEMDDPAFWVPVSSYVAADGRRVVYPHTVTDRAKPGIIAVDASGRRFVNEAVSYHEFVRAMLRSHNGSAMRPHLICDKQFIWQYGLGAVKPFTLRLGPFLTSGYLKRSDTIEGLAAKIEVDPTALVETVERYNDSASMGEDPEFGRGCDAYQRQLGDVDNEPNPCVAPIIAAPFYAIELRPGDLGTAAGIAVDSESRVVSDENEPIPRLYSVGNDAASIMQGNYPGPGITLGPALTFGYVAAIAAAHE